MGFQRPIRARATNAAGALTRRGLFEFAGLAIASTAVPRATLFARPFSRQDQQFPSPPISPVMETQRLHE